MEIFRDLYLSVEPDRMAATADMIERSPPPAGRDRAAEGRARRPPCYGPSRLSASVVRRKADGRPRWSS